MRDFGLDDQQLFPLLDARGDAMLRRLRQHPHAPIYNWRTGERLTAAGLANIRAYAQRVAAPRPPSIPTQPPAWLWPFIRKCRADVPFYRGRQNWPEIEDLSDVPITRHEHVRVQPWAFVADGLPLDELITYTTSGTTGTRLFIPATPELPNRYLPLLQHALASRGVKIEGGNRVSIVHVCAQNPTVVLCSLSTYLGGAGVVKINLHEPDWNRPGDAALFLDDTAAEIYTGDPFALWRLTKSASKHRPKAIISAGTSLSTGMRAYLASHFSCPVIDMISMNESGPIAFSADDANTDSGPMHDVLAPDLFVEILDEHDRPCPPGVRGQIVLTGGLNPYLPLVRYATGDHAALVPTPGSNGVTRLVGFHGREVVAFHDTTGRWFSSVDVASALVNIRVSNLSLHQNADGSLVLRCAGEPPDFTAGLAAIRNLFGADQVLDAELVEDTVVSRKPIMFSAATTPFAK